MSSFADSPICATVISAGASPAACQEPACQEPACQGGQPDSGRALIEVLVLAVVLMIPVIYLLIAVLRLQAGTFAVAQAARDAAQVIDTAPDLPTGLQRASLVSITALSDQNIPPDGLRLRFVEPGADCGSAPDRNPDLTAGSVYDVCVITIVTLPGVPTSVTCSRNTVTGVYTLHVGEFREGP
ncbi:hypothetical protein EH165_09725 [Nakamurella antarctica]|uniref:Pilus assembly protein n=1 Tax=Nakamurella antarctica TaxID=1902245 RepID=A0A3G8ZWK3_9ACTN|nr:hypothetical protein [Nakamurella antarctica]AZI58376.1 hypothetical protein EH165_09725 [Nakamurella antarctica]